MYRPILAAALLSIALSAGVAAQDRVNWDRYVDPQYGFSADLPYGAFEPLPSDGSPGLTLGETDGNGQISIYGGDARGLTLAAFAERLTSGNEVRDITYQAEGKSWVFVCTSCCIKAKTQPGYRYGGTWQGYRH